MFTMRSSTDDRKRAHYAALRVVAVYEHRRYGGRSGRYVHEREVAIILNMLPAGGRILDLPSGTGRIGEALKRRGFDVLSADSSRPMLEACAQRGLAPRVQMDAFRPCFRVGSFHAIVCLRFAYHYPSIDGLLSVLRPLLRPNGHLILDCLNWSVFSWVPILKWQFAGPLYIHDAERIASAASRAGLEVLKHRSGFFLSQLLYRYLPLALVRRLERLERHAPDTWFVKTYYCLGERLATALPAA